MIPQYSASSPYFRAKWRITASVERAWCHRDSSLFHSFHKTTASSPYEANAKVVFRITVKNTGETDLTNVVVTDNVPAHTDYDADATNALTSGWSCDGGTCTYTIGNLAKGEEKGL